MINEAEPKFQSVHTRSSFNQTFGGWYSNYVPLSTKFMQSILGKERVSVFHVGSADLAKDVENIGRIVGKKSALSTFTKVDKGEKLAKGRGIQSKGGIIYQLEGSLLVASTRDMQTHPDKTGRRWVEPMYLAGKVAGSKMQRELEKGIETNKILIDHLLFDVEYMKNVTDTLGGLDVSYLIERIAKLETEIQGIKEDSFSDDSWIVENKVDALETEIARLQVQFEAVQRKTDDHVWTISDLQTKLIYLEQELYSIPR